MRRKRRKKRRAGGEEGARPALLCYSHVGSVPRAEPHPRGQAHPEPTPPSPPPPGNFTCSLDRHEPFTTEAIHPYPRPTSIFPRHLSWQMSEGLLLHPAPPPSPHISTCFSVSPEADAWEILAIEEPAVPEWGRSPGAEILATVFPRDQFCLSTRMLNHAPMSSSRFHHEAHSKQINRNSSQSL